MTWSQAQSYCRAHFTDLASVRNPNDNNRVVGNILDGGSVWIGLFRDMWKWSNGDKASYTFWASGHPYSPTQNCVAANFGNAGLWTEWTCSTTKAFICHHGES